MTLDAVFCLLPFSFCLLLASGCRDSGSKTGRGGPSAPPYTLEEQVRQEGPVTIREQVKKFADGRIVRHGPCTLRWDTGEKMSEGAYIDDKEHGTWIAYFKNGRKSMEGKFVFGHKHGTWVWWNEEGEIVRKEQWSHGRKLIPTSNETTSAPVQPEHGPAPPP